MTSLRFFSFILLVFTSFTVIAQTCTCCDGLGVVYERTYVTEYDNLRKGTTSGWNARDVYTYTSKRNVRKTVEKRCSCCGGSGNPPQRQRRVAPRRQEPKTRYVTTSEMMQMSLHKFKQGYRNIESLGNGYYYAQFKHNARYYVFAKVHSTELGYEIILKDVRRPQKKYNEKGDFKYYRFSDGDESFYYDQYWNFKFQTGGTSSYLGFDDLFWVGTNSGVKLMRFPQETVVLSGNFKIRSASEFPSMLEEYRLWRDHKLLFARSDEDALGVVNKKGEYIIPPLFSTAIMKFDEETQVFELLDKTTNIYHYFKVDGQEILAKPKLFKTCDNGDEIYEFTRNVYTKQDDGKYKIQKRKIYELKAKASDQGLPPYYQYCSCYNEDGVAKVVKFNSKDTILADVYGKLMDQEVFAELKSEVADIPLPNEEKDLLRMMKEAYRKDIKVKQINGVNKFACDDYKDGAFVFDEIKLIYSNSLSAVAAKNKDGYIIFQKDRDFGYNWIKSTYQDVDDGAVDGNIIPVQNKKGKWGAVFLSGRKKKLRQIIGHKYDRFELFSFEDENRRTFALFNGNSITWIKTNVWNKRETKKIPYKVIEEKTEFRDHIRWLKKSKQLRAFTVLTLFKYYDVDPKKDVLSYMNDGSVHLLDIGEGQKRLWHNDYRGEQFKISEDIVSIKLTRQSKRIEGIQEYLDLHLDVTYQDGQTKKAKAIYVKGADHYEADQFVE